MTPNVLIVGGGLAGLAVLKECLSKGLKATIFEAEPHTGGQWRYTEPDASGKVHSSVYKSCIFNSCRDTSAFSDFPFDPARYPVYFGHEAFVGYLDEYAAFFGLEEHIRLGTRVAKSVQTGEGKWSVTYEGGGVEATEVFDALFACTGHVSSPYTPEFVGLRDFKGEFSHSHIYRTPGSLVGKKVALIGMGSSAVDIATELGPLTEKCHLITRIGGWVFPRFVLGKPLEAWDSRISTYLPSRFSQWLQTVLLNVVQGRLSPELQPKHRILEQNPTVNSSFLERVNVGTVTAHRTGVERFTENGLVLTNGEKLEVDTVIACTGYLIDYPYLPSDSYQDPDSKFIKSHNSTNLFQLILPQNYSNLFFIGLAEAPGPAISIIEMQARWSIALLTKSIPYPALSEMKSWASRFQTHLSKTYPHTHRHTITFDPVPYLDGLSAPLRANPTLGRLLKRVFTSGKPFRALSTLSAVYMDVTSSAQWRLFGRDSSPELAEASILRIAGGGKVLSEGEKGGLEKLGEAWGRAMGGYKEV